MIINKKNPRARHDNEMIKEKGKKTLPLTSGCARIIAEEELPVRGHPKTHIYIKTIIENHHQLPLRRFFFCVEIFINFSS